MPNQPDINKKVLGAQVSLVLYAKIRKDAAAHNMTLADYVNWTFFSATDKVILEEEDYQWIAEQVRTNTRKRQGGRAK